MRLAAGLYDGKPHAEEMIRGEPTIPVAGAKVFRIHQLTWIKPPFAFDPAKPPASDKATVLKLLGRPPRRLSLRKFVRHSAPDA